MMRPLGRTAVDVTALGFGAASIAGLYEALDPEAAVATVRHAYSMGIRYFDVAPLYGSGNGERRLGAGLAGLDRDSYVVSTKVGVLLHRKPPAAKQHLYTGADFPGAPDCYPVFDFSYDAIIRSVEESLERLGLGRIDVLYVHDPDDYFEPALRQAIPALQRLKSEGLVQAIGVGMNQAAMLVHFAREAAVDCFLVAGRYTLLDQRALPELLPLCEQRGIGVVIGGVYNSGVLADPRPGSRYDYTPAPAAVIARVARLSEVCRQYGVPLKAAALQFPLAHPAVVSVLAGARSAAHLDKSAMLLAMKIPGELWAALRAEGLIPAEAPTPGSDEPNSA